MPLVLSSSTAATTLNEDLDDVGVISLPFRRVDGKE